MTMTPIDETPRRAALDTDRSHHVESPAGSGKTLLLTTRFLKLLGIVDHPREIVALTFTEKAAGEMRSRVHQYLQRAAQNETPLNSLDGELLEYAAAARAKHRGHPGRLTASDGLHIMTFHGFCRYITQRAPVEAGIAPDMDIIDEQDQMEILDAALQQTMDHLFSLPKDNPLRVSLHNRLLHHNNNWLSLSSELHDILRNRDQFADLIGIIRESGEEGLSSIAPLLKDRLRKYADHRVSELARCFSSTLPGKKWPAFIEDLKAHDAGALADLPPCLPGDSWEELPRWQAIARIFLTKKGTPARRLGPQAGFYPHFIKSEWGCAIAEMEENVAKTLFDTLSFPDATEPVTDMAALGDFIILAAQTIGKYENICRTRQGIDFVGLEQAALRALREGAPSDLHLYLDHQISHLLIDEFQDTNRNQWELIKRLCGEWQQGDGRTIFIVGDPKQSIYAFRKADVSLFYESKAGIPLSGSGTLPLESHILKANFRSSAALIEWTNEIFGARIMAAPDADADEVPYSPSLPGRDTGVETSISLKLFAGDDRKRDRENEARWLASEVNTTRMNTKGEQSIAVLLFTRNRLADYLRAFREYHVPVQVQEGLHLTERPEVMHLFQMTRLIAFPHDDLAWASLLRSPWTWFDRAILHETATQAPLSWREKIRCSRHLHPGMDMLNTALDRAFTRAGRDPLGEIVGRLWEDLDGPRRTASWYGMAGIANCRHFLHTLTGLEKGTPQETLRRFERSFDSLYEPADPSASRSPVQVMTIHRAKGLEFDIVFLPFLDWKPLSGGFSLPPPYLSERLPGTGGAHLVAMAPDRRRKEKSKTYQLLKTLRQTRRTGEAKRWFYVAVTRARSHLFMSGVARMKENLLHAPSQSVLSWVMNHEGIDGLDQSSLTKARGNVSIALNPTVAAPANGAVSKAPTALPEEYRFLPEKTPYRIASPSLLKEGPPPTQDNPLTIGSAETERIRGSIIHRILHRAITGGAFPSRTAIAKALFREGMPLPEASENAEEIETEVLKTLDDPFISSLLRREGATVRSEWALEDLKNEGHIRSGSIDLAVWDGTAWWIIDFKTSRPSGEATASFLDSEARKYRLPLADYRSMLAGLTGTDDGAVRSGLYFTALQLWKEVY